MTLRTSQMSQRYGMRRNSFVFIALRHVTFCDICDKLKNIIAEEKKNIIIKSRLSRILSQCIVLYISLLR